MLPTKRLGTPKSKSPLYAQTKQKRHENLQYMLTLQSSKSQIVCLLIFKVNHDTSQGVSFSEVLGGSKAQIKMTSFTVFEESTVLLENKKVTKASLFNDFCIQIKLETCLTLPYADLL